MWETQGQNYHLSFAKLVLAMRLQPAARLAPGVLLSMPFEVTRVLLQFA